MKKTLAAVLAAAMALSTATVALATDFESEFGEIGGSVSTGREIKGEMGKEVSYIITTVTDVESDNEIPGTEMAAAIKDGAVTASVIVMRNKSKLSGLPTLRVGDYKTTTETTTVAKYTWRERYDTNPNNHTLASITKDWPKEVKRTVGVGKEVTALCMYSPTGQVTDIPTEGRTVTLADSDDIAAGHFVIMRKGDTNFDFYVEDMAVDTLPNGTYAGWFDRTYKEATTKTLSPELKFTFNHTYGTGSVDADFRLRFTVKKSGGIDLGDKHYDKGDTITTEVVTATAKYYEMDNLHTDMQLTIDERNAREVLLNGANLYNEIGNADFTVTFADDIAMFVGKSASNQKTVNLWYDIDDDDTGLADKYPDVDFTFIDFKGTPTFQKTGTLVFAAKDKNTAVYEWDGEAWNLVSNAKTYDPTYKTISVEKVKKLGKYAVAFDTLPEDEEPEEPAEPVDSTPVAEPDEDEGGNPNTGAC